MNITSNYQKVINKKQNNYKIKLINQAKTKILIYL